MPQATTALSNESPLSLAVLNPGGKDCFIDYTDGPGVPGAAPHAPINYHAYAAATRGAFHQHTRSVLGANHPVVLVLIRRRVEISLKAVQELKAAGRTVLVAWKESGPYQITQQLSSTKALEAYQEILIAADGIISPTAVLPPRWGWITAEAFAKKTRFIPTPYPLEFNAWDFSEPITEREGILIGTREFLTPTRNHLRALSEAGTLASELSLPVTVINGDQKAGLRLLHQLEESFPEASLRIIDRPLDYAAYLCLMAKHRLVFQLDRSAVPGQVAGDALLCRTLCGGGNSALEGIAFPDLADDGSGSLAKIYQRIRHLLTDNKAYEAKVEEVQGQAIKTVGYEAVDRELRAFVEELRAD